MHLVLCEKKGKKSKKDVGSNRYDLNVFGFAYSVGVHKFCMPQPTAKRVQRRPIKNALYSWR
jgi:hypothetical protein